MRRIAAAVFSVLAIGAFGAVFWTSTASAAGPTAIAVDSDGVVYVGFASGGQIKRYSGVDGSALASWGTPGSAAGQIGGVVGSTSRPEARATSGSSTRTAACRSSRAPASSSGGSSSPPAAAGS